MPGQHPIPDKVDLIGDMLSGKTSDEAIRVLFDLVVAKARQDRGPVAVAERHVDAAQNFLVACTYIAQKAPVEHSREWAGTHVKARIGMTSSVRHARVCDRIDGDAVKRRPAWCW